MKPTKVQREILTLMATGDDIEDYCYDYPYAICVGEHRHMPRRTLEALKRNGWIKQAPTWSGAIYYQITTAGRLALAAATQPFKSGGESGE